MRARERVAIFYSVSSRNSLAYRSRQEVGKRNVNDVSVEMRNNNEAREASQADSRRAAFYTVVSAINARSSPSSLPPPAFFSRMTQNVIRASRCASLTVGQVYVDILTVIPNAPVIRAREKTVSREDRRKSDASATDKYHTSAIARRRNRIAQMLASRE